MDFYDEIASDYDAITGSLDRESRAEDFLKALMARSPLKSALDAACGTGLYATLLAKMGVGSVGADISAGMLGQAKRRAQEAKARVDWVCASMQELAVKVPQRFDAVLCMGNSMPHLLTDADLHATIAGFLQLLSRKWGQPEMGTGYFSPKAQRSSLSRFMHLSPFMHDKNGAAIRAAMLCYVGGSG